MSLSSEVATLRPRKGYARAGRSDVVVGLDERLIVVERHREREDVDDSAADPGDAPERTDDDAAERAGDEPAEGVLAVFRRLADRVGDDLVRETRRDVHRTASDLVDPRRLLVVVVRTRDRRHRQNQPHTQ